MHNDAYLICPQSGNAAVYYLDSATLQASHLLHLWQVHLDRLRTVDFREYIRSSWIQTRPNHN